MTKTVRAFGYTRLSKDEADSTSLARQRQGIERLCRERGWELVEVFTDGGRSAFSGRIRPAFERMMGSLDRADVLCFWRLDRLARSLPHLLKIADACEKARVQLVSTDGEVDTTSAAGRAFYQMRGVFAEFESRTISERSRQMHAYKRERGEPVGRMPFGWRKNGKGWEPDPEKQKILATAARRFIRGERLGTIATDLGFSDASLSRLLHSPRVQEALPNDLDIASAFAARERARVKTNSRSLLGGLARCGVCGRGLATTSTKARNGKRWGSYTCPDSHVGIASPFLDAHVSEAVIAAVDTGKLEDAIRRKSKVKSSRKVSEIEARLEVLEADHYDGKLPRVRFERHRDRLLADLQIAQEAERENGIDLPLDLAHDLAGRWETLGRLPRRQIIAAVLSSITVRKAAKPGVLNPDRVELDWRGHGK